MAQNLDKLPMKGPSGLREMAKRMGIKVTRQSNKKSIIKSIIEAQPKQNFTRTYDVNRPAPPPPPGMTEEESDREIRFRFAEGTAQTGTLETKMERKKKSDELRNIYDAKIAFEIAERNEQLNIRNISKGIEQELNLTPNDERNSAMENARALVARARRQRRIGDIIREQEAGDAEMLEFMISLGRDTAIYMDPPPKGRKMRSEDKPLVSGDADPAPELGRIKSQLNSDIYYNETRLLNQRDKDLDVAMYEIDLFGMTVTIALGNPINYEYHIFFPVYIIQDESRVAGQIGGYEVFKGKGGTDLSGKKRKSLKFLRDEDGDLDITDLELLLYSFVDKKYIKDKEYLKYKTYKQHNDGEVDELEEAIHRKKAEDQENGITQEDDEEDFIDMLIAQSLAADDMDAPD